MSGGTKKSKKGEPKAHIPPSKVVKIICRVCSVELLLKNYERHLQHTHPEEDCTDLRDKKARKLSMFYPNKERNISEDSGVAEDKGSNSRTIDDEGEELTTDNLLIEDRVKDIGDGGQTQTLEEMDISRDEEVFSCRADKSDQPYQTPEVQAQGTTNDDIMQAVQKSFG